MNGQVAQNAVNRICILDFILSKWYITFVMKDHSYLLVGLQITYSIWISVYS